MKPRRTPLCFFSNASRYSLRSAMTALMSTSLKVVSIAALFCASFSRSGDGPAQAGHLHALLTRLVGPRRLGGRRRRGRWRRPVEERQHVALGDAAILARASADGGGRNRFSSISFAAAGNGSRSAAWYPALPPAREQGETPGQAAEAAD